jgi:branched-chain amino acid transport system permease protein
VIAEALFVGIRGIAAGALLSLVAMSLNVVFNATGVLNFALGTLLILGGFLASMLYRGTPTLGMWLLFGLLVVAALAILATVQGYITLLPLRFSVEQDSWLITTMAASVILGSLMLLEKGPYEQVVRSPLLPITILGTRTPAPYVVCIGLALFWFAALRVFMSKTLTGLAISALSQDFDAARAAGFRVRRLQLLAFTISGAIIGSAGFVAAPVIAITPDAGVRFLVNGFVAAIIGGIGNNLGALIGGPVIGLVTVIAVYTVGDEFQGALILLLLVAVLLVSPEGLFGHSSARRV